MQWCRMPAEIRYILFEDSEVAKALFASWKARGRALPRGTVCAMRSEDRGADGNCFVIEFRPDGSLTPQELESGGDDLRDALVQAARAQSIPLPARAAKRVERIEGQLCIAMRLGGKPR